MKENNYLNNRIEALEKEVERLLSLKDASERACLYLHEENRKLNSFNTELNKKALKYKWKLESLEQKKQTDEKHNS